MGADTTITSRKITPQAQSISDKVSKLPDPLFMTDADHAMVDELLSTTLYQIDKTTQDFDASLKEYRTQGGQKLGFRHKKIIYHFIVLIVQSKTYSNWSITEFIIT